MGANYLVRLFVSIHHHLLRSLAEQQYLNVFQCLVEYRKSLYQVMALQPLAGPADRTGGWLQRGRRAVRRWVVEV